MENLWSFPLSWNCVECCSKLFHITWTQYCKMLRQSKRLVTNSSTKNFLFQAYGHNSVVFAIECQTNWTIKVIKELMSRNAKVVQVKKQVEKVYMNELQERLKNTVWNFQCGSWYVNHLGVNTTLYPGSLIEYWNRTRKPVFSNLDFM